MLFASGLVPVLAAVLHLELAQAAPTRSSETGAGLQERASTLDLINDLNSVLTGVADGDVFKNILTDLELIPVLAEAPISGEDGINKLKNIYETDPKPANLFAAVGELISAGLTTENAVTAFDFATGLLDGENSETNWNPLTPAQPVYPKAEPGDAPYSLTEAQLREAIYIPPTFQYGRSGAPQPIILVPGTGVTGYTNFVGNYIPLLQQSNIADPVWLNIPGFMLNDAQTNAEYIAYAIGYISGISGSGYDPIAVLTWSQGGLDAQWVTKYWPSTRHKITDIVAFSPDYHGTVLANFVATPDIPLPPSYLSQEYTSNFVAALRADGGDSAYVTTTTIYSGFYDEIVEPQQGTNASAYLLDARNVGVSNNEVQSICPAQPAGSFYTHEGTLYNPIGFALLVDALSHEGPGQVSRIDVEKYCSLYLTPGLDVTDFLLTENAILLAAITTLTYPDSTTVEPPVREYARLSS